MTNRSGLLEKVAHKVQTVFYLSEIMVDEAVQKRLMIKKRAKSRGLSWYLKTKRRIIK